MNIQKIGKELLKKKGVVGFSSELTYKVINGKVTDKKCMRIYVEKKQPLACLNEKDIVPLSVGGCGDSICTDVVEVGKMVASPCVINERPVRAGASGMNYQGTACTLGAIGKSTKKGEEDFLLVIANNHCCARENKASVGEAYLYPSPMDGGVQPIDKIAEHLRHVEIKFEEFKCRYRNAVHKLIYRAPKTLMKLDTPVNSVDIGCDKIIIPHDEVSTKIFKVGSIKGKRRGIVGEKVHKNGRTTGYTEGATLLDNNYYGSVQYSRGTAMFGPCALYQGEGFSAGGDSSSAILAKSDNNILSFLFAGSDTHTIGCHIDLVEELLEVDIICNSEE